MSPRRGRPPGAPGPADRGPAWGRRRGPGGPPAGSRGDPPVDQVAEVDGLLRDGQVVALEAAQDQEVLDDPEETLGFLLDVEREVRRRVVAEPPAQDPGAGEDRRDRRAQL